MSGATRILVEEHDVIERMLGVLKTAAERLERGEKVPPEIFLTAVDFIRNFADHCHHTKEEDILFKLMEKRGFAMHNGPISVMLMEHDQGRLFTRNLESAAKRLNLGNKSAKREIIFNALGYVNLLTSHIYKENNILYPIANNMFTREDQEYLEKEFERVEKELTGEGVHEKYHHLVHELEAQLKME
jgi:hemerythrin-like domain-containing protein